MNKTTSASAAIGWHRPLTSELVKTSAKGEEEEPLQFLHRWQPDEHAVRRDLPSGYKPVFITVVGHERSTYR